MAKKNGIIKEFSDFISRGNVMDLAVGVIIGGAFTAIVNSVVNDIIGPIIGKIIGGIDLANALKVVLTPAAGDAAEVAIRFGALLQSVITFLMTALAVFLLVKGINVLHKKKEEAPSPAPEPPKPSEEVLLLREIRDSLKK